MTVAHSLYFLKATLKSISHAHGFGKYWEGFPAYVGTTVCLCLLSRFWSTDFNMHWGRGRGRRLTGRLAVWVRYAIHVEGGA